MPTLSEFPAAVSLSVTAEELDTPVVCRLLYVSAKLSRYSRLLQALVDGGSSINLIHESIVSLLKIPVTPCIGPKVSLGDGKTMLSCNSFAVLEYTLAGVSRRDAFFVSSIGAQAMILGMPWLEKVNPLIDWVSKTVEPRPVPLPTPPPSSPSFRSCRLESTCSCTRRSPCRGSPCRAA